MSSRRRLVVEISAQARNWSLPVDGIDRIVDATPPGWETVVVDETIPMSHEAGNVISGAALAAAGEAEVYYGWGVSEEVYRAAPKLRWVHSAAAGVGRSLFPAMVASEVTFSNSAGVMGDAIAEHALAGVLFFLRGFDIAREQQQRGHWSKAPFTTPRANIRELCECRVVVIGTGGVGAAVAERFSALGATCVGVRRSPDRGPPPGFESVVGPEALDALLPTADVVVLAAPLTPSTRGILSASRIDCLGPGAIVVNVARGALLDERALARRLGASEIRGAVLDVFQEEPLPSESPLWALERALLTPHVSYVSPRLYWQRAIDLFLDNWARYLKGEPLRNVVDKEAGY
ncbi:MAG: D-2-hydroxyacid dehydrogenase [Gemmatimonadaceae bacterium]